MSLKHWLRGGGITGPQQAAAGRPRPGARPAVRPAGGIVVPAGLHRPAQTRPGGALNWGPVRQPIGRPPITAYGTPVQGVPLQPGQASGKIPASGTITLSIGPAGFGNVWYPAQVTVSTTTGPLDTSTCNVYLGPANTPVTLLAQIITGNGVLATALPNMTAGQYLIAIWTGGHTGDTAAINITGTMDTIST